MASVMEFLFFTRSFFNRISKLLSHKTKMKSEKDGIFLKYSYLNSYCTRSSINCKCFSREIIMTNRLEHGLHIGIYLGVPLNGQPKWHLISSYQYFLECLTCTFHVTYRGKSWLTYFYLCSDSCLYLLKVSIFLKECLCEKGHKDCFRVIQRSQASFFNIF